MTGGLDDIVIKDDEFIVPTVNNQGQVEELTMFEWRNAPKSSMKAQAD
jgi:hypothetical protein